MPEPTTEAVHSSQDEPIASTPPIPADKLATAEKIDKAETLDTNLMDLLDIPLEVQQRIAPKAEEVKAEGPKEPEAPVQEPQKDEEPEELEPDEEEAEEEAPVASEQPQRVDKRLKRINRLTRQKNDLERQVDHIISENQRLRGELERGKPKVEEQVVPLIGGDPSIDQNIKAQDAVLRWCDQNADGGNVGEGDKAQFVDAQTVREWRRDAELKRQELVVDRKDQIKDLAARREQFDRDAFTLWPEMFDKSKPEYQEAVAIVRQYPFLASIPEANLALGQLLEGRRALMARQKAAQKNGQPQKQHRDLDERVFTTPRVPIAPHTPEPPSRESKPSPTKKYNEAMSRLTKDSDGGVENLASVFSAMDEMRNARPGSRSPVKS